ncbi:MAG: hypothetical protein HYX83_04570 [Chloroflexi bacterium]|nr:hypothetical protein [Chloroflexota bacterium]
MKRALVISVTVALVLAIFFGVFPSFLAQASDEFKTHVDLPVNSEGTLNGANYTIRVPANWNGTLLVYAHGYLEELQTPPIDAAPGGAFGESILLSMGYAVAGTANRNAGWGVKEGIRNTLALTQFFKGHVSRPKYIILWGFSMGSVIALESIEKYPGIYDGAIAGAGLAAGAPLNFDQSLALSLAYDVIFGWPESWGSVGDVRDDLDFDTEVLPLLPNPLSPANGSKFEFIRRVIKLPPEVNAIVPFWLFTDMFYATQVRGELEQRAGGPVAQNLDHVYTLTAEDIAVLADLEIDAPALLALMNARTNIQASVPARKYLERYADFTGDLTRPVITIHTRVDELVRVANQSVYRRLVQAAGKEDMLIQLFTDAVGHGNFTAPQLLQTVAAMEIWLNTGVKPPPGFFPPALGFIPLAPPPWPFVQQ